MPRKKKDPVTDIADPLEPIDPRKLGLKLKNAYARQLEQAIEQNITSMPGRVERLLDAAVVNIIAGALGLRHRYGEWELNNNLDSPVAQHIGSTAVTAVMAAIPDFVEKLSADTPNLLQALQREYKLAFERAARDRVVQIAARDGQNFADTAIATAAADTKE